MIYQPNPHSSKNYDMRLSKMAWVGRRDTKEFRVKEAQTGRSLTGLPKKDKPQLHSLRASNTEVFYYVIMRK